jgi:hypothetical protein
MQRHQRLQHVGLSDGEFSQEAIELAAELKLVRIGRLQPLRC